MAAVPAIAPVTEETSGSQKAVKGKGHVVRKPKPERQETDLKIDKIKEEIGRCNARIAEIEGILRSKRNNRMAPTPESKALRDQLSALRDERNEIQGRRRLVKAELEKAYDSVKEMKALNEKLRQDYRLDSVDKIDRELEKLQAQQNSGQLSGSAEAKVVMEISKLQKNRADVSKARQQIDEKRDLGSCIPELKDQMNAISQSLTAIEKKEAGIKAELDALREQADVKNADIPELERERQEKYEVIQLGREKISELWDEWKKANQDWFDEDKKAREQIRIQMDQRRLLQAEEYKQRQLEKARWAEENAPDPYDTEVTRCDQLTSYLGKFTVATAVAAEARPTVEAPQGMKLLKKKGADEDIDDWAFSGKKGPKAKKGKAAAAAGSGPSATEKFTHTPDILDAFSTIKVKTVLSRAEVAGALEAIAVRKAYYLEQRAAKLAEKAAAKASAEAAEANGDQAPAENGEAKPSEEGSGEKENGGQAPERRERRAGDRRAARDDKREANGKPEKDSAAARKERELKLALDSQEAFPSLGAKPSATAIAPPADGEDEDDEGVRSLESAVSLKLTVSEGLGRTVSASLTVGA